MGKKVRYLVCVFSISLLLSSCGNGENTNTNANNKMISEENQSTNHKIINEENQSIQSGNIVFINDNITNLNTWEESFTAVPDNGENLHIVIHNSDQTDLVFVVWIQDVKEKRIEIKKNEEVTVNFNILSEMKFRVQLTSVGGQGPFSASIKATQF